MIRYRVADSNGQWIERGGISNYNTRLEGLQPLTTYEYQVKAQNQYGWSEWSVTGTGRTETGTRFVEIWYAYVCTLTKIITIGASGVSWGREELKQITRSR